MKIIAACRSYVPLCPLNKLNSIIDAGSQSATKPVAAIVTKRLETVVLARRLFPAIIRHRRWRRRPHIAIALPTQLDVCCS